MSKQYVAGANFERDFIRFMESKGEYYGIRSAGSHGLADVILIPIDRDDLDPNRVPIACQLKRSKDKNKQELQSFINKPLLNCIKWWVSKEKGKGMDKIKIEVI